ncbi:lysylphosphatidylglycerol synthase domain-containing protein [Formosa sp. L2A11]|uniref:lysylphosphatidylglycerol synthase domain-containing protein n=1 Tax=Formosa sp. L2A11 TaxID=2686363 RepID=UPI00131DCA75|nr:lysylphosphatidylglycerol synthase domain-containing protein [Formosa sp. L2A11]
MHAKALTFKSYQILIYSVKISIIAFSFYFIYHKLFNNNDLSISELKTNILSNNLFSFNSILIITLLSVLNWFFEILKWKTLVNYIKNITFKTALEQTLGAHTASLFTPNRIGDYGAKALYFQSKLRSKIVGLNGIGNLAQMLITTILGSIGLFFFASNFPLQIDIQSLSWPQYLGLIIVFSILFIIVKRFGKPKIWLDKTKHFLTSISISLFLKTLLFSGIRYVIFSFQFYVLLYLFHVDLSYLNAMMIISSMYLLASILPSIFIFDVVLKGSIAVYLFSFFNIPETIVLSCITIMWLFNVVLPSLIGTYFVMNFKLLKS